jgi:uncharacterized protein (DUF433 family)
MYLPPETRAAPRGNRRTAPGDFVRGSAQVVTARRISAMATTRSTRPAEVISDPSVMGGAPVIRGTRIPAVTIAAYLQAGRTDREVFEDYPSLPVDGIEAVRRWQKSPITSPASDSQVERLVINVCLS